MRELIRQLPSTEPTKAQLAQMERAYGMFIHFGVNTFGNVEWSDGGIDARSYQPDAIDADGWVKAAYDAGMNYVILITKHHDGFRLWDPHPCREDDPKLYSHEGQLYYMPFEMTICSREGFSWFYSNIYEQKPMLDVKETAEKIRRIFRTHNMAVINMPPNTRWRKKKWQGSLEIQLYDR